MVGVLIGFAWRQTISLSEAVCQIYFVTNSRASDALQATKEIRLSFWVWIRGGYIGCILCCGDEDIYQFALRSGGKKYLGAMYRTFFVEFESKCGCATKLAVVDDFVVGGLGYMYTGTYPIARSAENCSIDCKEYSEKLLKNMMTNQLDKRPIESA